MTAAVKMFIEKFDKVVTIDEDHPLAVAQREKDAKVKAAPPRAARAAAASASSSASAPAVGAEEEVAGVAAEGAGARAPAAKLSRKTVKQLTALCKKAGIDVPDGSTKKDLIALLEGASE